MAGSMRQRSLLLGRGHDVINPNSVLACIFALGIGLAFGAPVWGAIVPDIVSKDELPSAITLGGVQLNLSGIVGPALGGFLLPLLRRTASHFIQCAGVSSRRSCHIAVEPRQMQSTGLRENFTESFISSLRYARNSQRMKIILFRNVLFSLVISIVPALLPVIALKELRLFRFPTRPCLYMRGRRVIGRSGDSSCRTSGRGSRRMQSLRSRWR